MERLAEIRRWARGCSLLDLEVAGAYLEDLRKTCRRVIEDNPGSNTRPEELVYRMVSLLLLKLETLKSERAGGS